MFDNIYNIIYNLLLIYLLFTNLESFCQSFIFHLADSIFHIRRKKGRHFFIEQQCCLLRAIRT